jgi:peptidoglycan/LPS O-acetylase OafA/YrhL
VADNAYERNQWSLGWEMRGSMVVFLVLFVTAVCTTFWRRVILVCSTIYFFKSGEFITPFLFFAGTLHAEISLIQIAYAKERAAKGILDAPEPSSRIARYRKHWPAALFIFALFLGTSPPENAHRAAWSRLLRYIFEKYIATKNCTSPTYQLF